MKLISTALMAGALGLACAACVPDSYQQVAMASCGIEPNQYKILVQDNGMGKAWQQTSDTRHCPQAGIGSNFWKPQD